MLTNTLLNTGSSVVYFFLQWLCTVLAVRLANFESAGVYALAISFTNLFYFIALFGARNYQLSDAEHRFSDSQFFAAKLLAAMAASIAFCVALVISRQSAYVKACYAVFMVFKLGEAWTIGYFPLLQLRNDYRRLALSYTAKGMLSTAAFAAALAVTHDLLTAVICQTAGLGVCILLLDIPHFHRLKVGKPAFRGSVDILRACFPLALESLTVPLMNYVTRASVERELGDYLLGQYSSLSFVIVVLSTFATTVFVVFIPRISAWKLEKSWGRIGKYCAAMTGGMAGLGVLCVGAGVLLGPAVCSLIFGKEILENIDLLVPLIITAVALMVKSFYAAILVPLERRWTLLWGECAGTALCAVTAGMLTRRLGMKGTNLSYLIGILLQLVVLTVCAISVIRKGSREEKKNGNERP